MSPHEIVAALPRLRDTIPGQRVVDPRLRLPITLVDNFYFMYASPALQAQAEQLAQEISQISRGKKTRILSANSELVGKLGEFVIHHFLTHYYLHPFQSNVVQVNPKGGDVTDFLLQPGEVRVDVKTRQLHTDETIAPTFDLRVPHTEVAKYQDVYILAGYCPTTNYGYALGWCSWEELHARPVNTEIKFPARCVPLLDLHPLSCLDEYVTRRAAALEEPSV